MAEVRSVRSVYVGLHTRYIGRNKNKLVSNYKL